MRVRILGAGWYGCHLGVALKKKGIEVEVHESADQVFSGASGSNPARLHCGAHYPRSRVTRAFCQDHNARFMEAYGDLTRAVPVNLYAIAAVDSYVDFGTYLQILKDEIDLIPVHDPTEFGLQNCEGAILTGERHIVIRLAREHFTSALGESLKLKTPANAADDSEWDFTIDATFCALAPVEVDRYEPCVIGILSGPTERAVTIMDGPFGSIYPWDPDSGLLTISSAKFTPFSKSCKTWDEARALLDGLTEEEIKDRVWQMMRQMSTYWPDALKFTVKDWKLGIRALPKSAADARIVDAVKTSETSIRIRAGKIDAVFQAQALIEEFIGC